MIVATEPRRPQHHIPSQWADRHRMQQVRPAAPSYGGPPASLNDEEEKERYLSYGRFRSITDEARDDDYATKSAYPYLPRTHTIREYRPAPTTEVPHYPSRHEVPVRWDYGRPLKQVRAPPRVEHFHRLQPHAWNYQRPPPPRPTIQSVPPSQRLNYESRSFEDRTPRAWDGGPKSLSSISSDSWPNPAAKPSTPGSVQEVPVDRSKRKSPTIASETETIKRPKGFDKLALLCSATIEMGPLHDNPTGCSCPKSKCVALYCDCFKAGRRCNPAACSCVDCKNTIEESGVDGARTKAIRCILARNPRAFSATNVSHHVQKLGPGEMACNCIRSRCLKLYCTCFQSGKTCRAGVCTCIGCYNTSDDEGGLRQQAIQQCLEKRPDAFKERVREPGVGCACKNNRCIRKYCECFRSNLMCTDKCSCRECENVKVTEEA